MGFQWGPAHEDRLGAPLIHPSPSSPAHRKKNPQPHHLPHELRPERQKGDRFDPRRVDLEVGGGRADAFVVRTARSPCSKAKVGAHGVGAVVGEEERAGRRQSAAAMEDVVIRARAHKTIGSGNGGCGGPSPCSQGERLRPWRRWCKPVLTSR
jgi:hypothetical protein